MANLLMRVTALWQNWPGAPGYTHFYFTAGGTGVSSTTQAFFEAIKGNIPSGTSIQTTGSGDIISDDTGLITGSWSETTPTGTSCTGVGNYSGASGAVVSWRTDGVFNRRRVRGRTYVVPMVSGAFDSNGSLSGATITALQSAANAVISAAGNELRIWARPGHLGAGSSFPVTTAVIPDLAAVLRSRRV